MSGRVRFYRPQAIIACGGGERLGVLAVNCVGLGRSCPFTDNRQGAPDADCYTQYIWSTAVVKTSTTVLGLDYTSIIVYLVLSILIIVHIKAKGDERDLTKYLREKARGMNPSIAMPHACCCLTASFCGAVGTHLLLHQEHLGALHVADAAVPAGFFRQFFRLSHKLVNTHDYCRPTNFPQAPLSKDVGERHLCSVTDNRQGAPHAKTRSDLDLFCGSQPAPKPAFFSTNVSWLLDTRKDAMKTSRHIFLLAKDYYY